MKVIGIDGNEANVEKRVGISEYSYQLLKYFQANEKDFIFKIFLKKSPLPSLPALSSHYSYEVVKPAKFWTQFGLPTRLFRKRDIDLFFTTSHYAPRLSPVPTVISVMDLSYIHFPELFKKRDLYKLTNWTKYSSLKAKKIITISNSSKNDIIKFYKIPAEKIEVVYPGIKEIKKSSMNKIPAKYGVEGDFILYIGTLQPRKNVAKLIEAVSLLEDKKVQLVIIGKKGWKYEEILEAPKKYQVEERIKFLNFVPDQDLPAFYSNAICYVLPSLYEGFGLPILEAMQHGCPVLTSNISSLPEAGGDAAVYFDPYNVDDIASKIEKVMKSDGLREEMKKKGNEHVKNFSWEKSAKKVLDILEGAIDGK